MSLDDESPTQYFGADAQVWKSKDGRVVQLSPAGAEHHAERLAEHGWIHSGQEPLVFGPEEDFIPPAPEHRVGCSHSRTGRCICSYLAQWDKYPEYTAPAFKLGELSGKPVATPDSLLAEIDAMRADITLDDAAEISAAGRLLGPGVLVIPDEMWDDFDHAKLKVSGSPEFISASEYMDRQAKAGPTPFQSHLTAVETSSAPFPMEEKDYYPVIDQPIKALTVDGEIWEPRRLRLDEQLKVKYWHGEYKDIRRRLIAMFGMALAGWAFATARGIWGF